MPHLPPFGSAIANNNRKNKKKKKNKSQSKIKPLPKIRERDVGRFGFLDSEISLYVGQVDGSGDLMECVVKKWWLRGRKWQREIWERAESVRSERRERRGIKNNKKWIATCYSMVLVIKSWQNALKLHFGDLKSILHYYFSNLQVLSLSTFLGGFRLFMSNKLGGLAFQFNNFFSFHTCVRVNSIRL